MTVLLSALITPVVIDDRLRSAQQRQQAAIRSSTSEVDTGAGRLGDVRPMRIDYDEAQTTEERSTYRSPFHLPFEFLADIHPIARLKALRTGKARTF